jgi:hypothetical protein
MVSSGQILMSAITPDPLLPAQGRSAPFKGRPVRKGARSALTAKDGRPSPPPRPAAPRTPAAPNPGCSGHYHSTEKAGRPRTAAPSDRPPPGQALNSSRYAATGTVRPAQTPKVPLDLGRGGCFLSVPP